MDQSEKPTEGVDKVAEEFLEDSEIIPCCIHALKKEGFEPCVQWLKTQFCEVAYSKYGGCLCFIFMP